MNRVEIRDESEDILQQAEKLILIVEDDSDVGDILVYTIQIETPYQALLVPDGFQALEIIKDIKPHLFILDYQLPRLNGLELYDRIHATEGLEHVPALFLSASLPCEELEKRRIPFLKKTFAVDELRRIIGELLG